MRLKLLYISSGWGTAKNCLPCSCFHLCCKLCLGLMQSRKQLPSILGHHPKTLVLLGIEPYAIFLTATRYHQLSSTSHTFPKAWDLLITEAADWGKHFVQNDAKREWLILLRWRRSTGQPAWQVEVASYLRKHPPGLLLCPARSNIPRSCLHTTIFLSMKMRTLLKAQQIQTKTPHFCICWDYFRHPPYHTSPQSLATASNTSDSILLLFTPVHVTVGFFFLPWSNHLLLFLYLQNLSTTFSGASMVVHVLICPTPLPPHLLPCPTHREKHGPKVGHKIWLRNDHTTEPA